MSDLFTSIWARRLVTLATALVGVAAFHQLSLPLPWLLGPLTACLVAAFAQVPLAGPGKASDPMRTILGVAVGASITPDLFARLGDFALTMALVPALTVVIGLIGVPFLHRVCRFDRQTAFYGAMPGGLQDMLVFGEAAGADSRALSLIHATRIVAIVIAAPFLMQLYFSLDLQFAAGADAAETPLREMLIMLVCAVVGWRGGLRIGLFGASIIGPLILAAAASLTGLIHQRPPAEAIILAQLAIGTAIGARYVGITFAEFRRIIIAALAFTGLIMLIAGGFAWVAVAAGAAGPAAALLAYAPGGQAEITVLAIVAGVDPAFVVAHHVFRIVIVIAGAPYAMRLMTRIWPDR